jgi:hypothetical protein
VLDYVPGLWVRKLHVVCDASLFILQFHASHSGAGQQGEMVPLFSVQRGIRRLSMGQGSKMFQSLMLIYALSSDCWKKNREMTGVHFS